MRLMRGLYEAEGPEGVVTLTRASDVMDAPGMEGTPCHLLIE
jgi:hypothetical protein